MHGGVEPSIITANLSNPGISGRAAELRKEYQGRFVFLGIDKVPFLSSLVVDGGIVAALVGAVAVVVSL